MSFLWFPFTKNGNNVGLQYCKPAPVTITTKGVLGECGFFDCISYDSGIPQSQYYTEQGVTLSTWVNFTNEDVRTIIM